MRSMTRRRTSLTDARLAVLTGFVSLSVAALSCSEDSTGTVLCPAGAVCALHPTLFVVGQVRDSSDAPLATVPVLADAYLSSCGSSNLAEAIPKPLGGTSDSLGHYVFGIQPQRERPGVCLRLRAIHGTDTIVTDTGGLTFIPPPAVPETLTINFVFP